MLILAMTPEFTKWFLEIISVACFHSGAQIQLNYLPKRLCSVRSLVNHLHAQLSTNQNYALIHPNLAHYIAPSPCMYVMYIEFVGTFTIYLCLRITCSSLLFNSLALEMDI
jgi:hypothetical protein